MDQNFFEVLQFSQGPHAACHLVMHIELYNFLNSSIARVGDIAPDSERTVPWHCLASKDWTAILNCTVCQAMPKRIQGLVGRITIAVVPSMTPNAWTSRAHSVIIQWLLATLNGESNGQAAVKG